MIARLVGVRLSSEQIEIEPFVPESVLGVAGAGADPTVAGRLPAGSAAAGAAAGAAAAGERVEFDRENVARFFDLLRQHDAAFTERWAEAVAEGRRVHHVGCLEFRYDDSNVSLVRA